MPDFYLVMKHVPTRLFKLSAIIFSDNLGKY